MARTETLEVAVGDGTVHGTLSLSADGAPGVTVLVCPEPPGGRDGLGGFTDELCTGLVERGIAVGRFRPRTGDPATSERPSSVIDDASAFFRALLLRDDVDPARLAGLGARLGAVAAAGLAGRTDQLAGLVLVAPATGAEAVARCAKRGALPSLLTAEDPAPAYLEDLGGVDPVAAAAVHARPTLIVLAAGDGVVPSSATRAWAVALENAGRPVTTEIVAGGDPDFAHPIARGVCRDRIESFLLDLAPLPTTGPRPPAPAAPAPDAEAARASAP